MSVKKWVLLSFLLMAILSFALAKDKVTKLKGQIELIDHEEMILKVADRGFWLDDESKLEDMNSTHISFDAFEVGTWIELEYDLSKTNTDGFIYASKLEIWK